MKITNSTPNPPAFGAASTSIWPFRSRCFPRLSRYFFQSSRRFRPTAYGRFRRESGRQPGLAQFQRPGPPDGRRCRQCPRSCGGPSPPAASAARAPHPRYGGFPLRDRRFGSGNFPTRISPPPPIGPNSVACRKPSVGG